MALLAEHRKSIATKVRRHDKDSGSPEVQVSLLTSSIAAVADHLRKGVAGALLMHIVEQARVRGYRRLSLETGSMQEFLPAQALYRSFGFECCSPFGAYVPDPNSVFMSKELN